MNADCVSAKILECPVSLEPLTSAVSLTPCAHKINEEVAKSMFGEVINGSCSKTNNCPVCRVNVTRWSVDHQYRQLVEALEKKKSEPEQAAKVTEVAVRIYPTSSAAQTISAQSYTETKVERTEEVAAPFSPPRSAAQTFFQLTQTYVENNNKLSNIESNQHCIELCDTVNKKIKELLKKKQYPKALEALNLLLKLSPCSLEALVNRALTKQALSRTKDAKEDLDKAFQTSKRTSLIHAENWDYYTLSPYTGFNFAENYSQEANYRWKA
jgi:tetratricopeptide (TPR) repeat protein